MLIVVVSQNRLRKKQTESFKNILVAQEKERERIAKDMHDQVGPLLSKLKLSFDSMNDATIHHDWINFKLHSQKIIDQTLSDIRTTSYDLMPKVLYTNNLTEAIEDFCEMMTRGISTEISFTHHHYPSSVSKQSELNIYRILQEIINNALKYSQAKNIVVSITGEEDKLIVYVKDDGTGFDFEKMKKEKRKSHGLQNIESRTYLLGGKFQVKSKPNLGTSYLITFKNSELK